jgi:hypothetical protein
MNFKNTWLWMVAAAVLFGLLYFFRPSAPEKPGHILPGFKASEVRKVQVRPAGQVEISVERTNGGWRLTQPVEYPAQAGEIEKLLAALEQLTPAHVISEQELKAFPHAEQDYGFTARQFSLTLDGETQIAIGSRTATGDQVFLQVAGENKVYVVDAALLDLLPQLVDGWRDPSLVDFSRVVFDSVVVSNNALKVLEVQRNATNQLWRMIWPISTRADSGKVEAALRGLQNLRAAQFVSDDAKPDLEPYGLQTPELSLAFRQDTNTVLLLEFGKTWTNNPNLVYARRSGVNAVVMVQKEPFQPWLSSQSDYFRTFFDYHLLALAAPPDVIEVTQSSGQHFRLEQGTNHVWRILPEDLPGDAGLVGDLVTNLCNTRFPSVAKDVVTDSAFADYGLAPPACRIQLNHAPNSTEGVTNVLDFGMHDGKVYGRRDGERMVYNVDPKIFERLQEDIAAGWKLRDLRIWSFSEADVTNVVIRHGGRTREINHVVGNGGTNIWSLAAGSQGIINDFAVEDAVHQLGELTAVSWVQRGGQDAARYGFGTNDYQVSVALRDGGHLSVELGGPAPSGLPYAMAEVGGEPWIFIFPIRMFLSVQMYLSAP